MNEADVVTAIFTAIAGVAAAIAAGVAIATLTQMKRDSHDRTRPLVLAKLEWPALTRSLVLVIENSGGSPARDVVVKFTPDPLIVEGTGKDSRLAQIMLDRYAKPIELLPVGGRMSNVYFSGAAAENSEPLPDQFQVSVQYTDIDGRKSYADKFALDVRVQRQESYSTPADRDYTKRAAKALEAIAYGIGRHP